MSSIFHKLFNIVTPLVVGLILGSEYQRQPDNVIRNFGLLYYARNKSTWGTLTWNGIHAEQNPNDVWMTQEIISEIRPDLIIETGTNEGGGALVWANLLMAVNPNGKVVTIDIEDKSQKAREVPLFKEKIDFLLGSSTAPEILEQVRAMAAGKKVLVILDSLHTEEHVSKEIALYGPLVTPGSYMIVQDSSVNGHPGFISHGPGPYEAIEQFMSRGGKVDGASFEVDRSKERLLFTMHPMGYLKRIL